jgi:1,4-dihydroxy-2-naphthoate polyprenyltransferase
LNEASDMARGIDLRTERTPFSGGSGTLPAGQLSIRATRAFALACALGGALIGVYFAWRLGPFFALLVAAGAVAVLLYSDVFARAGLGEIMAGLGLGALPVWGAAWVQGEVPGPAAMWAGVPAFFMTFNLLLLNEFPDEEADRAGGRRNIVLLLGRRGAALVYAGAALAVPAAIALGVARGALPTPALAAVMPSLALKRPLAWAFSSLREPVPVPALAANVVWNLSTNTALAAALVVARALR